MTGMGLSYASNIAGSINDSRTHAHDHFASKQTYPIVKDLLRRKRMPMIQRKGNTQEFSYTDTSLHVTIYRHKITREGRVTRSYLVRRIGRKVANNNGRKVCVVCSTAMSLQSIL